MSQNEAWQNLVVKSLDEIKDEQKEQRAQITSLREAQVVARNNAKWEVRIMSTVWGLIMLGINAILGRHGN